MWNGLSSWKVLVFIGVYVWLSDSTEKCHFLFAGCYSVHGMLPFRVFVPSLLKCFTAHSCYFAKWFRIPWKSWKSLLDIINQLSLAVQHSNAIRVLLLPTGSIVYSYWVYVCVWCIYVFTWMSQHWSTMDAENKVHYFPAIVITGYLFYTWSRSEYGFVCSACCQVIWLFWFLPSRCIPLHFFPQSS